MSQISSQNFALQNYLNIANMGNMDASGENDNNFEMFQDSVSLGQNEPENVSLEDFVEAFEEKEKSVSQETSKTSDKGSDKIADSYSGGLFPRKKKKKMIPFNAEERRIIQVALNLIKRGKDRNQMKKVIQKVCERAKERIRREQEEKKAEQNKTQKLQQN